GQGRRMGSGKNKLLLELGGEPILVHTLERLQASPLIDEIVLVAGLEEIPFWTERMELPHRFSKLSALVSGGAERQDSVFRGLKAVSPQAEWVGVHDGARPFITDKELESVIRAAQSCQAALLAVPVKETIKRVHDNKVDATLERSALWAAQTPQVFARSLIIEAYHVAERDGYCGTDDASLVERLGVEVTIVQGSYRNIKITTPEDLWVARTLWRQEQ
ncbi:MAG: 2-C-methyl-D-erythritol 4-phosphate cytidylyltransferase, partial [Bacillota bacterium]